MDKDSISGIQLLETIGECNSKLAKLGDELQNNPNVVSIESELECRSYPITGTSLSFYLDAELITGNSVSYFLGLNWDENAWKISSRISMNDEQGYKVIKDFPNQRTKHFNELLLLLPVSASELLKNSDIISNLGFENSKIT